MPPVEQQKTNPTNNNNTQAAQQQPDTNLNTAGGNRQAVGNFIKEFGRLISGEQSTPAAPPIDYFLDAAAILEKKNELTTALNTRNAAKIKAVLESCSEKEFNDLLKLFNKGDKSLQDKVMDLPHEVRNQVLGVLASKLTPEQAVPLLKAIAALDPKSQADNQYWGKDAPYAKARAMIATVVEALGSKSIDVAKAYQKATGNDIVSDLARVMDPSADPAAFMQAAVAFKGEQYADAAWIGALSYSRPVKPGALEEIVKTLEDTKIPFADLEKQYSELFPGYNFKTDLANIHDALRKGTYDADLLARADKVLVGVDKDQHIAAVFRELDAQKADRVIALMGSNPEKIREIIVALNSYDPKFSDRLLALPQAERDKLLAHVFPAMDADQAADLIKKACALEGAQAEDGRKVLGAIFSAMKANESKPEYQKVLHAIPGKFDGNIFLAIGNKMGWNCEVDPASSNKISNWVSLLKGPEYALAARLGAALDGNYTVQKLGVVDQALTKNLPTERLLEIQAQYKELYGTELRDDVKKIFDSWNRQNEGERFIDVLKDAGQEKDLEKRNNELKQAQEAKKAADARAEQAEKEKKQAEEAKRQVEKEKADLEAKLKALQEQLKAAASAKPATGVEPKPAPAAEKTATVAKGPQPQPEKQPEGQAAKPTREPEKPAERPLTVADVPKPDAANSIPKTTPKPEISGKVDDVPKVTAKPEPTQKPETNPPGAQVSPAPGAPASINGQIPNQDTVKNGATDEQIAARTNVITAGQQVEPGVQNAPYSIEPFSYTYPTPEMQQTTVRVPIHGPFGRVRDYRYEARLVPTGRNVEVEAKGFTITVPKGAKVHFEGNFSPQTETTLEDGRRQIRIGLPLNQQGSFSILEDGKDSWGKPIDLK